MTAVETLIAYIIDLPKEQADKAFNQIQQLSEALEESYQPYPQEPYAQIQ